MIRTSKEKIKEAGTKSSKKIPKMVVKHATATQPLPISTKKIWQTQSRINTDGF